jgi:DNA-binding GntR family transcriptional regulator
MDRITSTRASFSAGAPKRAATLVELAAEHLRESIIAGDMAPGQRIPIGDVAEELGMSLIPVREALQALSREGIVIPLPRRGYRVAPLSVDDLAITYQLRLILEPLIVHMAVPQLDDSDLAALKGVLDVLDEALQEGTWTRHYADHRTFHFGIYDKCGASWLIRFTEMLWQNTQRYQRLTTRIDGELKARMREHHRILRACRDRDADLASELMRQHLTNAQVKIVEFLSGDGRGLLEGDVVA